MKSKFYIIILLLLILYITSVTVVAFPLDMPDKASLKGIGNKDPDFLYNHFQEIANKMYLKKGWVPSGILEILESLGR